MYNKYIAITLFTLCGYIFFILSNIRLLMDTNHYINNNNNNEL